MQVFALICERSSAATTRERDMAQQRDPKQARRTLAEMEKLIGPFTPRFSRVMRRLRDFTDLRDKYAHAYLVSHFGVGMVQHLPHMRHGDAGLLVPLDRAFDEMAFVMSRFAIVEKMLDAIYDVLEDATGPDLGVRFEPLRDPESGSRVLVSRRPSRTPPGPRAPRT